MRQSAGKMLIKGFLESFFIVIILLGAGVIGFQMTMHAWKAPVQEAVVADQEETVPDSITEPSIDSISKNLIYCYDDETKEMTKLVLEVFNCQKHELTYITIPMRTQLMMSDSMYQSMIVINPEIPQVMQLSALSGYLDFDIEFDYGVLLMEDLLGIDISYYTAIPESIYNTIFAEKYLSPTDGSAIASGGMVRLSTGGIMQDSDNQMLPVEAFTDEYAEFLKTLTTSEQISTYIEEIYPSLRSNLTVFEKMNYLDSYSEITPGNVTFTLIRGNDQNSAFIIDEKAVEQQLSELD